MDGIHDLGGRQGHGRIDVDDPTVGLHDEFDTRVFGLAAAVAATGANPNIDRFRHAIERIDPAAYLTHTYYGRWLGAFEILLVEHGTLTVDEIDRAAIDRGGETDAGRAARPSATPDVMPGPSGQTYPTAERPRLRADRFAVGDRVRTLAHGGAGHTRLPAYVRGRIGVVTAAHGTWVFPDTNAHGLGESPMPLYTVHFAGSTLWGPGAEPGTSVSIDLFEPYLEAT